MSQVGKREFLLHTSKYLKRVEGGGGELTITHQNTPTLKVIPINPKSIDDLRGLIKTFKVVGNINDTVFPKLDKWSS